MNDHVLLYDLLKMNDWDYPWDEWLKFSIRLIKIYWMIYCIIYWMIYCMIYWRWMINIFHEMNDQNLLCDLLYDLLNDLLYDLLKMND